MSNKLNKLFSLWTIIVLTNLTIIGSISAQDHKKDNAVDLSQADPNYNYYLLTHVKYQKAGEWIYHNFRNKKIEARRITPKLGYTDLFWSNQEVNQDTNDAIITLETLFLYDYVVVGTDLYGKQILQNKTWSKKAGTRPHSPADMNTVWSKNIFMANKVPDKIIRQIGDRTFIITVTFMAIKKK
ncbi:MAG: hypothetical protein A2504_08890 [Bdellovibrionales bacterium RIFOXYD12_FULL_39_22]|nr:MAG: hypothetical protein A2385_13405 [Bdellovibrionales bacterium RIFOXYB1_FULL_39_21]OFZ40914.1 MAG: hypothetical protein A2485_16340 [Bdellovibrionales bacterium RIFOXYC12_FULL_39_17]OFZ44742.1 MAG: hypothetical protein A2404_10780 [Bdellovibrionales bacterium RIFOXYC1_FULL_39_130]OFZ74193.1 MAG: hypothetical protein A2560_03445 [Bdellovibrionales bacterium RIFOXYD1_FULL_39_84]OFZ92073.1 MAG: hypothetical protein A2504_08890 [Bdellovibrionales bacterium RIFOXYD12_FULL_39_22]HLE10607.1 hy